MAKSFRYILLLLLGELSCSAASPVSTLVAPNPDPRSIAATASQLRVAFIVRFFSVVDWPSTVMPAPGEPWRIAILGPDPFDSYMEKHSQQIVLNRRPEHGIVVRRSDKLSDVLDCHIVFISLPAGAERRKALELLSQRAVLTVGDSRGFIEEGGIIGFQFNEGDEKLLMDINLDQARRSSLVLKTKFFELSNCANVLDKGRFRKLH